MIPKKLFHFTLLLPSVACLLPVLNLSNIIVELLVSQTTILIESFHEKNVLRQKLAEH